MAIITRPVKPSSGGGTEYIAGADILDNEVDDDFNRIYTDYNGNITNANCAANMALDGSKIASKPNGVGTAQINADSVGDAELKDHVSDDAQRAVGTNHIKDHVIPSGKFKSTLGLIHIVGPLTSGLLGGGGITRQVANPSVAYAKATYDLIGLYIKNFVSATAQIVATPRADDTGANWAGSVDFANVSGTPATAGCFLVYVFIEKV